MFLYAYNGPPVKEPQEAEFYIFLTFTLSWVVSFLQLYRNIKVAGVYWIGGGVNFEMV
jgi:hypothetical protein